MKTIILVVLLLAGGVYIISKQSSNDVDATTTQQAPYHIVLGLDPSGTTIGNGWPWPNKSFFEDLVAFLENNGGGTLEIYNFSNAVPQSVKIKIKPMLSKPDLYSGEEEVRKIEQQNANTASFNTKAKETFWQVLDTKIVNYNPTKGNDYTYAISNINAMERSLKLPQYSDCHQFALIYSDLLDETPRSKPTLVSTALLSQISALSHLVICNPTAKNNNDFEEIGAVPIPSFSDFIEFIDAFSLTIKK